MRRCSGLVPRLLSLVFLELYVLALQLPTRGATFVSLLSLAVGGFQLWGWVAASAAQQQQVRLARPKVPPPWIFRYDAQYQNQLQQQQQQRKRLFPPPPGKWRYEEGTEAGGGGGMRQPRKTGRLLFVAVGLYGHMVPLLRLAEEMVRRGHDVTFATHEAGKELIRGTGVKFLSLGPMPSPNIKLNAKLARLTQELPTMRGLLSLLNEIYVPMQRPMYKSLMAYLAPHLLQPSKRGDQRDGPRKGGQGRRAGGRVDGGDKGPGERGRQEQCALYEKGKGGDTTREDGNEVGRKDRGVKATTAAGSSCCDACAKRQVEATSGTATGAVGCEEECRYSGSVSATQRSGGSSGGAVNAVDGKDRSSEARRQAEATTAALAAASKPLDPRVDLMVIDVAALGAFDVAHKLRLPYIINSPTPLFDVSGKTNSATTPGWGTGLHPRMTFWQRCTNFMFPRVLALALTPPLMSINRVRREAGLPPYLSLDAVFRGTRTILNTALGLEYPALSDPMIDAAGPLLPSNIALQMTNTSSLPAAGMNGDFGPALAVPKVISHWMEGYSGVAVADPSPTPEGASGRGSGGSGGGGGSSSGSGRNRHKDRSTGGGGSGTVPSDASVATLPLQPPPLQPPQSAGGVVYVSTGHMPRLEAGQVEAIIQGLVWAGEPGALRHASSNFRVLWLVPLSQMSMLPPVLPPNFRVRQTGLIPHLRLLAHPAVKLVLSHCGHTAAQEALVFGKPLLCMPKLGDQPDVAARVIDSGAGMSLPKADCAPLEVKEAVVQLLDDEGQAFAHAAAEVGAALRRAGGTVRAADIVEDSLQLGHNYLRSPGLRLKWHQSIGMDIVAVLCAVLCLISLAAYALGSTTLACYQSWCRSAGSRRRQKLRKASRAAISAATDATGAGPDPSMRSIDAKSYEEAASAAAATAAAAAAGAAVLELEVFTDHRGDTYLPDYFEQWDELPNERQAVQQQALPPHRKVPASICAAASSTGVSDRTGGGGGDEGGAGLF